MADPYSLQGKRILVTGASSGVGRQLAISAADRGAQLIITGRNVERLNETLGQLNGVGHRSVIADLTLPEGLDDVVGAADALDGVFVSAGIAAVAPFRMISPEHVAKLMSIDFEAPVLLVQRLLKGRRIREGGSIVFNTAGASYIAPAGTAVYSAAKAGLEAAGRSLALEVARSRIRVTSLRLGYVNTPLLDELAKGGLNIEQMSALAPLGIGTVQDAANATIFLLSDASRWISRVTLTCDGGMAARIV